MGTILDVEMEGEGNRRVYERRVLSPDFQRTFAGKAVTLRIDHEHSVRLPLAMLRAILQGVQEESERGR